MQEAWRYQFTPVQRFDIAKNDKKRNVDIMSRANLWANDKEIATFLA
jgi:hypothetical protein